MSEDEYKKFHHQFSQLTRLAVAQLIVAVNDADDSMNDLTQSFTDIVQQDQKLQEQVDSLPNTGALAEVRESIKCTSDNMSSNIQNAVISFQFFDRMCQRLEHTILCLKELSDVEESSIDELSSHIQALVEKIYHSYTMQEERQLYDEILNHPDFESALAHYRVATKQDADEDVELF